MGTANEEVNVNSHRLRLERGLHGGTSRDYLVAGLRHCSSGTGFRGSEPGAAARGGRKHSRAHEEGFRCASGLGESATESAGTAVDFNFRNQLLKPSRAIDVSAVTFVLRRETKGGSHPARENSRQKLVAVSDGSACTVAAVAIGDRCIRLYMRLFTFALQPQLRDNSTIESINNPTIFSCLSDKRAK